MRKIAVLLATLLVGASSLSAQSPFDYSGRWNVSLSGGMMATVSENTFGYFEHGRGKEIFDLTGAIAIGYDFTGILGMRVQASYGRNASGCNIYQTGDGKTIYPYRFQDVAVFADAILNFNALADNYLPFSPKLYGGLGGAYTFGFTDAKHPKLNPVPQNIVIGFRAGVIAEWDFLSGLGIFADLGLEAFDDWYNGIRPTEADHGVVKGYAGFPLDLAAKLQLGVIYHFK